MMQNTAQSVTSSEQKQIIKIVKAYLMKQTNDEQKTNQLMAQLAQIIQGQGAKLVHLGENVFLVSVQGQNKVEIENLSLAKTTLNKNIDKLMKYLRGIGVTAADYLDTAGGIDSALKKSKVNFSVTKDGNRKIYNITL